MDSAPLVNQKLSYEAALAAEFLASRTESSFTALFRFFTPQLLAFYRARGCEAALAEDLAQEVMLKVYLKAGQIRDTTRFRAWLFSIARNTLGRHFEKQSRQIETVDVENSVERLPAPKPEPTIPLLTFMQCMRRLDEGEREVMMLRFIEGWEYHEIASAKSIPIGTVQWRVFNAKQKLAPWFARRERLQEAA